MSAARREDYELVQEEIGLAKHKFLKHVECRLLSLHPALLRILQQMNPFLKFFQTEEPLFHLIYDQLGTLLTVLLGRFIRKDLLVNKAARKLSKIRLEVLENH